MILIGTDDGIYRWFDGLGWPIFHSLQGRSVVSLETPGLGVLAAVDRSGEVFESLDSGLNWRNLPLPSGSGRPSAITFSSASTPATLVMAVKPLNLYRRKVGAAVPRSSDEPPASAGFAPRLIHHARGYAERGTALLAPGRKRPVHAADAVRLAGWEPATAPLAPRASVAREVRVLEASGGTWFAAVSGAGLWKSADLGRSWSQCAGLPAEVYAVRTVPGRPGHLWLATGDGCRFSPDGGATWEDRGAGLEAARHVRAIEVKPDAPDTLLIGAAPAAPFAEGAAAPRQGLNFGLFETTSAGKSWSRITRKNFPDALDYDTITDIRYDPPNPDNIIVALGSGELWLTSNGGAYWGPLARQIKAARVLCAVG